MIKQAFLKAGVSVRIFVCWTVSSKFNIQKEETFWAFFFLLILEKLLIHEKLGKAVFCRHIYLFYLQKYLLLPFGKIRIKGIEMNGTDFKFSQYADDMTLILDGSKESFLESNFNRKFW